MSDALSYLKAVDTSTMRAHDRALALLWFSGQTSDAGLEAGEICRLIEQSGHPGQNASRLAKSLGADKTRVSRVPGGTAFRLHPRAVSELDGLYKGAFGKRQTPRVTDSVLPREIFEQTRGYIERVVYQINASYDTGLYDCCSVMCRRLLETLIIEIYEAEKSPADIKGPDGNFFMFSDLLRVLLADGKFNISRNAQKGLKDFKALGDQSAHSRRYNARQNDIDRVRDGMRVAAEELLHLAKLN
ncbi:MAG TPA: hypothetical protein VNW15_05825 [Rhizomicrobium sp.]|jgi:hypothetical protein|nr:hypothetical protein [Rhizomicrobium sp.]